MGVYLCVVSTAALLLSMCCCAAIVRTRREKAQQEGAADQQLATLEDNVCKLEKRLTELENGASPSYEKAKQAAQAVNDFNTGISAILNFDPHDVLKSRRDDFGGDHG